MPAAFTSVARVPNGDLVDLEVGNGFGLTGHEFFDLLDHEERSSGFGIASGAGHESSITLGFGFEHRSLTLGFGVVGRQGGVGLTLCDAALAFGLGFCSDLNLLLRDFLTSDFLGSQALAFELVLSLFDFDLSLTLSDFLNASALRLPFRQGRR